ncbi:protein ITPRID1 [Chanos chanos]|uniref:Protein ITPRID1 n=1 Tax=Chanos chanos TaxID=29144 RepID=A0A6J2UWK7_CHACN|nr:protein ITPRID1 [Chanos chanos]
MTKGMAVDMVAEKRAHLIASRSRWSKMEDQIAVCPQPSGERPRNQDSVQQWLISIHEENAKPEPSQEAPAEPLKRNASNEDDLALGTEASLYGKPAVQTVQEFLRSSLQTSVLPRWNSLTSAQSTSLSVMDVLNLWQDDPEELLLDLGFGCEEPDITGKIPARFINHPSKARGINIQLFLEAQKNRLDIENPDVRSRFRQLEVLHQVTTAFNSLVGGPAGASSQGGNGTSGPAVSTEAREKRKRMGMLLRKASKKTLSQAQDHHPLASPTETTTSSLEQSAGPHPDKHNPLVFGSLAPLVEEQVPDPSDFASPNSTTVPQSVTPTLRSRKRSPGEVVESFEMEEIQSFDEGSITGSCTGTTDHTGICERPSFSRMESSVIRANSCQSDSSGFMEEPFIPALTQQSSPGPELMKMLNAMSGDSTDSQRGSGDQCQPETNVHFSESQNQAETETESTMDTDPDAGAGVVQEETTQTEVQGPDGPTLVSASQSYDIAPEESELGAYSEDTNNDELCAREEDVQMPLDTDQRDTADGQGEDITQPGESSPSPEVTQPQEGSPSPDAELVPTELGLDGGESEMVSVPSNTLQEEPPRAGPGGLYLGRSVSVQMHSPLSSVSHTVPRRSLTQNPSLDPHSQSALRRRRESFSKKAWSDADIVSLSEDASHSVSAATPAAEKCFSPHPWRSQESSRGLGSFQMRSTSLDTGLSYEDGDGRWEGALMAGAQYCCSHEHRCHCCPQHGHRSVTQAEHHSAFSSTLPYSLEELEGMMRCMRKFCSVLTEIEERLEEEQVSMYSCLSDTLREEMQDILELRRAVKKEAKILEQQLAELVHHYDDNIRMKMNRLLDEQSGLCSQLNITPFERASSCRTSTRSVGVQCSLLPVPENPETELSENHSQETEDSPELSEACPCTLQPTDWTSAPKPDKMNFVTFIKSLKNSLQLSLSNDSLE